MAYAAVESLRCTLDMQSLTQSEWDREFKMLCYTLQQLDHERYRGIDRSEIHELEAKITEAVWKVEDVIESYQISQGVDLKGVAKQAIHSFFETSEKLREEYERALQNSFVPVAEEDDINIIHNSAKSTTVGLLDLTRDIISELQQGDYKDNVFSIQGMAGIGKTHLARDIYHHPLIVQHFELRLWVNIGPNHKDINNIFVDILAQIEHKPRDVYKEKDFLELRYLVWECMRDRTYFIVFDDVWNSSFLTVFLSNVLPENSHPRRHKILVTSRISNMARPSATCQMPFLKDEESWTLLSQNVFGEKPFPTQLEKPGKKIAQLCEGLPLLILAVADILRGLDQTEEYWNEVAEKKNSTFPDAYDRIYKVLVSSYDYLDQEYKAIFLYMGVFRQSHEILTTKLTHLWMVEGLYIGKRMVEKLASHSLAIICKQRSDTRKNSKSCKLHSTYWYVCVTEARKTKLFHVLIKLSDVSVERAPRRLSVQNNMLFGLKDVYDSMAAATSLTRSLIFSGEDHQYPVKICFNTMLLMKVLDALAIRFYEFPNEVLKLVLLRYLALTHYGELPSSISKLQCLRFLILRRHHNNIKLLERDLTTCLPKEIWDLPELRYLRIMGSKLPDPSRNVQLPLLVELYVNADSCNEGVFRGTPKLWKLGVEIELQPEGGAENLRCLEHICFIDRLGSLKCVVVNPRLSSKVAAPPNHLSNLPMNLRKLTLNGLGYPWKHMSAIGLLPNLRMLKLRCSAFQGPEWEIQSGEFMELEYLLLEDMDVVHWRVEDVLPSLCRLIVRHCFKLKMIPYGCFPNLETIEVDECSPSIVEFALQRKGNADVINYSWSL